MLYAVNRLVVIVLMYFLTLYCFRQDDKQYGMLCTHYSADGKAVRKYVRMLKKDEGVEVTLQSKDAAMCTIVPVLDGATSNGLTVHVAAIGLIEMLNGGGSVRELELGMSTDRFLRGKASVSVCCVRQNE